MKKVKTFWMGNYYRGEKIGVYPKKPSLWYDKDIGYGSYNASLTCYREEAVRTFRGTGVKLPRKNSKQLIPFHIMLAKGK